MGDRTVHGKTPGGQDIVRYDRTSKWYVEMRGGDRFQVYVFGAATLAWCGKAYLGRPGGQRFDAEVRRLRAKVAAA